MPRQVKTPTGVPGFRFAGVACGLKQSGRKDLALIASEGPAAAAAVFTKNRVKSPSVTAGAQHARSGQLQAVVVNSGNANACTGPGGLRDAEAMCAETARHLGIDARRVLPSSTGIIGVRLPMDKINRGIADAAAALAPDALQDAAQAIMTTDNGAKIAAATCRVGGRPVHIAGIAKGAGMIAPNMATMLCYVLTDAAVAPAALRPMVRRATDSTFHAITVDGDTSTNDTVLCLANGVAGNPRITPGGEGEDVLERELTRVMKELALKIVADGEGSKKLVEIRVDGARTVAEARKVAFTVANSKLVKTAFFGEDPNIGRFMMAIGNAGVPVVEETIDVALGTVKVVRRGLAVGTRESAAAKVMQRPSFTVRINLGMGAAGTSVWTSDLGHEYVRINSDYRT
ncbi:MAG: bifunctional glutamate N-acetyltransferase/amino-acid acetyltransferase ArgJ [Deltaproteobacteria bacterium]|nr:bifunctional glutamate N-acetyltransferase/amino-acid acetyltransferase ArgJ [Deltaproteobacteria bacterium]